MIFRHKPNISPTCCKASVLRYCCISACTCLVAASLCLPNPSHADVVNFEWRPLSKTGQTPPKLLNKALIHYPDALLGSGQHATVKMQLNIDAGGKVESVIVVSGPQAFHKESRTAVKNLIFEPARIQDEAVSSQVLVDLHFAPNSHSYFNDAMVVVVEASVSKNEDVQAVTTVTSKELDRQAR